MGNKNGRKSGSKKSSTTLSEKEIKLLRSRTGLSRDEIVEWHLEFINICPTGNMNIQQFTEIYNDFYPDASNSDKTAKSAFKVFDTDNSGTVSFSEFLIATSFPTSANLAMYNQEELEDAFGLIRFNN